MPSPRIRSAQAGNAAQYDNRRVMLHRHLDTTDWTVAAVASVLERGGASDVLDLLRALSREPHGPIAEAALRAAAASSVYGYPELLRACLNQWRQTTQSSAGNG